LTPVTVNGSSFCPMVFMLLAPLRIAFAPILPGALGFSVYASNTMDDWGSIQFDYSYRPVRRGLSTWPAIPMRGVTRRALDGFKR